MILYILNIHIVLQSDIMYAIFSNWWPDLIKIFDSLSCMMAHYTMCHIYTIIMISVTFLLTFKVIQDFHNIGQISQNIKKKNSSTGPVLIWPGMWTVTFGLLHKYKINLNYREDSKM